MASSFTINMLKFTFRRANRMRQTEMETKATATWAAGRVKGANRPMGILGTKVHSAERLVIWLNRALKWILMSDTQKRGV